MNRALAAALFLSLQLQPNAAESISIARAPISVAPATDSASSARDGQRDFDFEIGTWTIHMRRRVHPLSSDTTWVSPEGYTHIVQKVWDGRASLAQLANDRPTPHFDGLMLRLYNAQSHQWSIYWGSAKSAALDAPLVGEFTNGRGVFYNQDTFEGRQLFVRVVYSDITATSFRTESSYSVDGGKTWEPTLIQTFTRVEFRSKPVVQHRG
jgi:hypothetical protein